MVRDFLVKWADPLILSIQQSRCRAHFIPTWLTSRPSVSQWQRFEFVVARSSDIRTDVIIASPGFLDPDQTQTTTGSTVLEYYCATSAVTASQTATGIAAVPVFHSSRVIQYKYYELPVEFSSSTRF